MEKVFYINTDKEVAWEHFQIPENIGSNKNHQKGKQDLTCKNLSLPFENPNNQMLLLDPLAMWSIRLALNTMNITVK